LAPVRIRSPGTKPVANGGGNIRPFWPAIGENGVLKLTDYYREKLLRVSFCLKYVRK
jgi:hypothetical protein